MNSMVRVKIQFCASVTIKIVYIHFIMPYVGTIEGRQFGFQYYNDNTLLLPTTDDEIWHLTNSSSRRKRPSLNNTETLLIVSKDF